MDEIKDEVIVDGEEVVVTDEMAQAAAEAEMTEGVTEEVTDEATEEEVM